MFKHLNLQRGSVWRFPIHWGMGLTIALLAVAAVQGQVALRSSITGVVTDPSGAVVPGAKVTLKDIERGQTRITTTNEVGLYTFSDLTFGQYRVTVEHAGFSQSISPITRVEVGQTVRIDLTLQTGEVRSSVTVSGKPPLLQTEGATVGGLANRNFVENLPSEGRNYTSFAQLATNISVFPRGNGGTTFSVGAEQVVGGVMYEAGGGGGNGFYINGVNNNDNYVGYISYAPSVDAISEVQVDVANFSAANGRDVTTLNAITRGGTDQYHGEGYGYLENDGLNAIDPYTKATVPGATRNFLQRYQYGGNFGGPIYIPKLIHGRDKAFFFVNYERLTESDGSQANFYRVPSLAERNGDFSELLQEFPGNPQYVLYNPYSTVVNPDGSTLRTPIPNNNLNAITKPDGSPALNPQALQMIDQMFPTPNYVDPFGPSHSLNNFQIINPGGFRTFRVDSRFDFRVSNQDSFYITLNRSNGSDHNSGGPFAGFPLSSVANVSDGSILLTGNYARILKPNLANEFVFSWGRGNFLYPEDSIVNFMHNPDSIYNKFFQNLGSGPNFGVHLLNFGSGYPGPGYGENFRDKNPSLQFSDNLSWIKGAHNLEMGFAYFLKREIDYDFIRTVTFDTQFTWSGSANVDANGNNIGHVGGDSMADFELGLPTEIQQRFNFQGGTPYDPIIDARAPYYGAFIQDKWQLRPDLTLNLGLRYDLSLPLYDANRFFGATINFNYPGLEMITPGRTPGLPLHYIPADKTGFAPRISLAYRMKHNLVLRAGYGIFNDAGASTILTHLAFYGLSSPGYASDTYTNARFGVNADVPYFTFDNIFPPPETVQVGNFPISTGPGAGYYVQGQNGTGGQPTYIVDKRSSEVPYFQTYMARLEKGFGNNTVLSLTYMGTQGREEPYFENENLPPYCLGCYTDPTITDPARPYTGERFTDIWVLRHGLNSFYNAGTIELDHSMSHGLQLHSFYTYSRTVQDYYDPAVFAAQGNFGATFGPVWQYHRQRGEAPYSHPNRFVTAFVWRIPYGRSLPTVLKPVLFGWQLSDITTFESGNADTVFNSIDSAFDLEPGVPLRMGNPNLPGGKRTFTSYFNTAAFADPGAGHKGNAGPGIVRGPGRNNWDVSLEKIFKPTEKVSLDVRADFFNAFNHTQWSGINTTDGGPGSGFGSITGAFEPRIMQLGLKLSF